MSPITLTAPMDTQLMDPSTLAVQFERLLVVDRTAPEFQTLWTMIDRYLAIEIENERSVEA